MSISVFDYTDYRKYLQDYYEQEKSANRRFTYRHIAQEVGFKSAGFFTQILQGTVNISSDSAARFSAMMGLKKREEEYFCEMVQYNQAKKHGDKRLHFENMAKLNIHAPRVLSADQYAFYDKWYYAAIREALDFFPCSDDTMDSLGAFIIPAIQSQEIRKALDLLERIGLIQKGDDGFYKKTDAVISSGYDAHSLGLNNFVIDSLRLAGEAIDRFPRDQRNLSWMTMSVSQEGFLSIQDELRKFRAKALDIAKNDLSANRVYQFNFQIFPMTKEHDKESL